MKDNKKEKGYVKINIKDEISKSAIIQINYEFEKGTLKRMLKSLDKIIFEIPRIGEYETQCKNKRAKI